jgi:hypothetical protein
VQCGLEKRRARETPFENSGQAGGTRGAVTWQKVLEIPFSIRLVIVAVGEELLVGFALGEAAFACGQLQSGFAVEILELHEVFDAARQGKRRI